jgi:hypothetical protein
MLDSGFRVRGTKGLRVVDASAFPRTPGAFRLYRLSCCLRRRVRLLLGMEGGCEKFGRRSTTLLAIKIDEMRMRCLEIYR